MPGPIAGIVGGTLLSRAAAWFATSKHGQTISSVLYNPFVQAGQFGIGYTGGAYLGYGLSNTADPLGLHKPKYSRKQSTLGMPYGSYGRRRYSRYSGYSRYSRRSYYRRRRPYYRRSYY